MVAFDSSISCALWEKIDLFLHWLTEQHRNFIYFVLIRRFLAQQHFFSLWKHSGHIGKDLGAPIAADMTNYKTRFPWYPFWHHNNDYGMTIKQVR